ncbi:MAG: chromate transporter [Clostridiales bacterium]
MDAITNLRILISYLKIGTLAFGGGYALLPLLEREFAEKRKWLTPEELLDYFALSNSIPGLIAVNTATFLGYRLKGISGALCAALGMILPSLIIISVIATFFQTFGDISWLQSIFKGLNIAIVVLLLDVLIKMRSRSIYDLITFGIFGIVLALYLYTGLNPGFFVLFGALVGLLLAGRSKQ